MSKSTKKMCDSLGIPHEESEQVDMPVPVEVVKDVELVQAQPKPAPTVDEMKVEDDYEFARSNLREIIETASKAMFDMGEVARESESPRAYEVLATLLANAAKANEQLLALSKQKKDIGGVGKTKMSAVEDGNVSVQNAIFVGSTSELAKMLKDKRNG